MHAKTFDWTLLANRSSSCNIAKWIAHAHAQTDSFREGN